METLSVTIQRWLVQSPIQMDFEFINHVLKHSHGTKLALPDLGNTIAGPW